MHSRSGRYFLLAFCLLCLFAASHFPALAQQTEHDTNGQGTAEAEPLKRYVITLAEYHLEDIDPAKVSEAGIADKIKEENIKPVETLLLSALADQESMVQFGRMINVTTGRSTVRGVTQRITQDREVGTILRAKVRPIAEDRVSINFAFEASRNIGENTEESPPEMTTTSITTTQMLELDETTIVGGTTAGESTFLFISVSAR